MLEAISLRTPERKRISADEAFSKVFGKNDWGQLQRIDGWACPECSEPVFLKPPQERTAKGYSFVVRAHFCHYSTKAAAQCALYKAASHKSGQSQLEAFHRDRKQSLAKFLSSAVQESSYIAELLKGEEEFLRQAVRELNAKQPSLCSPDPASIINESDQFNAVQTHKRLQGLDNFLAGIFTIGLEGKSKARKGFVATTRRRAELRKLISRFGSNRKAYFSIIASNGLDKEHDDTARSLIGMIHADIERSRQEGQGTYHGASSAILESLLNSTSLLSPGEPLPDYTRYILSLPLLGSRLEAFNAIAPSGMQISRPPSRSINTHARSKELPPVRITKKGTLFVDESIIQKLLAEGSKLDGLTHFVRPRSHPSLNCYLLIPGNNCILLTSSIHADPTSPHGSVQMCQEILSAPDSELPEMLWEDRICLLHREKHVKADRSGVAHLIKTINQEFKQSCTMDQGGRRYKRVHSGIRITLDGDNSSK